MVSNSSWDDKKIESLLKQMPKVEDSRSLNDIYYNVQNQLQKNKRKHWFIPMAAAAAVILLSFILYPAIFPFNQASNSGIEMKIDSMPAEENSRNSAFSQDEAANSEDAEGNKDTADTADTADQPKNADGIRTIQTALSQSALYSNQLTNDVTPITYAVPDEQGQIVVPVTITVPNNEGETWADQYKANADKIPYEDFGLNSDFLPLTADVSIAKDNTVIQINFPKDHPYANGSIMNRSLLVSLDYALTTTPYNKALFLTDGNPGVDLGNLGEQLERNVNKETQYPYFIFQMNDESEALLSPYTDADYATVQDALEAMKDDIETHFLRGPLKNIDVVSVAENETELVVELSEQMLEETEENMLALEAILLTAKNFGFETVYFKHPVQQTFASFSFNTSIQVPVAPNYLEQYSNIAR